jgi:hypothetical protein
MPSRACWSRTTPGRRHDRGGVRAAELFTAASADIIKPADFDSFTDVTEQIAGWFLGLIELPRSS